MPLFTLPPSVHTSTTFASVQTLIGISSPHRGILFGAGRGDLERTQLQLILAAVLDRPVVHTLGFFTQNGIRTLTPAEITLSAVYQRVRR